MINFEFILLLSTITGNIIEHHLIWSITAGYLLHFLSIIKHISAEVPKATIMFYVLPMNTGKLCIRQKKKQMWPLQRCSKSHALVWNGKDTIASEQETHCSYLNLYRCEAISCPTTNLCQLCLCQRKEAPETIVFFWVNSPMDQNSCWGYWGMAARPAYGLWV